MSTIVIAKHASPNQLSSFLENISSRGTVDYSWLLSQEAPDFGTLVNDDAASFGIVVDFLGSECRLLLPMSLCTTWTENAVSLLEQKRITIYTIASASDADRVIRRLREITAATNLTEIAILYSRSDVEAVNIRTAYHFLINVFRNIGLMESGYGIIIGYDVMATV